MVIIDTISVHSGIIHSSIKSFTENIPTVARAQGGGSHHPILSISISFQLKVWIREEQRGAFLSFSVHPSIHPSHLSVFLSIYPSHLSSNHSLLQGIFPTQGSNPGLPYCWQILYHLSHQGSPFTSAS